MTSADRPPSTDPRTSSGPIAGGPRRAGGLTTSGAIRTVGALTTLGALRRVVVVRARNMGRATEPVFSSLTPLGWTVLGVGVAAWIAGALLGWRELLLAAALCLLVLILAVPFVLGRPVLAVDVQLDPARVTAGHPSAGRLRFANRSPRRSPTIDVDLPVGSGLATFRVSSLAAGATDEELFIIPTERRGVIPVGPPIGVKSDPLSLLARRVAGGEGRELIVHPRTIPLPPLGTGLLRDLEGLTTKDTSASDLAFHSLREYSPGDDMRHVHWRSTAKTGSVQVRQYNDTRRSAIAVVVDSSPSTYGDPSEFETALEVAASVAVRAARDQLPTLVMAGRQAASSSVPHLLLDALARAELAQDGIGTGSLAEMSGQAAGRASDTTTVILVSGSQCSHTEVQRAATRFAPEVTVVAVRVVPGGAVSIGGSGRVRVLDLPALTNLPALIAAGGAG